MPCSLVTLAADEESPSPSPDESPSPSPGGFRAANLCSSPPVVQTCTHELWMPHAACTAAPISGKQAVHPSLGQGVGTAAHGPDPPHPNTPACADYEESPSPNPDYSPSPGVWPSGLLEAPHAQRPTHERCSSSLQPGVPSRRRHSMPYSLTHLHKAAVCPVACSVGGTWSSMCVLCDD